MGWCVDVHDHGISIRIRGIISAAAPRRAGVRRWSDRSDDGQRGTSNELCRERSLGVESSDVRFKVAERFCIIGSQKAMSMEQSPTNQVHSSQNYSLFACKQATARIVLLLPKGLDTQSFPFSPYPCTLEFPPPPYSQGLAVYHPCQSSHIHRNYPPASPSM